MEANSFGLVDVVFFFFGFQAAFCFQIQHVGFCGEPKKRLRVRSAHQIPINLQSTSIWLMFATWIYGDFLMEIVIWDDTRIDDTYYVV